MHPRFEQDNPAPIIGKRYKLINQLGMGGFGQSFLAQDLHLPGCPRCVVKRLLTKTHDPKHLKTARRLFDTEARVLYQLGKHDQIPTLYAHFEENQEFYLVQEFIEGEPLTWKVLRGKPWAEERVIALLHDILEILAFVHQQNVIHRDIKPANLIRRNRDGKLVLIDFGAVKQVSIPMGDPDSEIAESTISVGTQGYISNEQLAGRPRFCSDVYAVGMVGIQALTGVRPKRLDENAATGELDWRIHVPNVSPEFAEVLDRMVLYDFRDRYPTAVEALESLQHLPPCLLAALQPATVDSPLTQEFGLTDAETDSTQKDLDFTYASSSLVPTYHQEETLMYGEDNSSTATSVSPPQNWRQTWLERISHLPKKWQGQAVQRWTLLGMAGAIAGVSLFLLLVQLNARRNPANNPTSIRNPTSSPRASIQPVTPPQGSPAPKPTPLSPTQKAANLRTEAERLLKQRQYQQALDRYEQLIKLKSNDAQAHWGRCESLNGLQQPDQAIVACNDALDLNPDYAEALWSQGKALRQQDRILGALRLFEEATIVKPDFADAWLARGSALQEVGRSAEAIDALDQAIVLNRNSAEAWSIRGSALWNLGRFDQAVASLDKALQIQPNASGASALRQQAREELGY